VVINYIDREEINLSTIILEWSDWVPWNDLKIDARSPRGITIPDEPGVYEVKYIQDDDKRVDIGRTSSLRMRIKQGLIKGKSPHSTGERLRGQVDVSKLVVRWALTERPCAVEEELHIRYKKKFGKLPEHTMRT